MDGLERQEDVFLTCVGAQKYLIKTYCTGYACSLGTVADVDQQFDLRKEININKSVLGHVKHN